MTIERALLACALVWSVAATAQGPAPAPAAPNAAAQPSAEPTVLGRFFFTPDERAQIDEIRRRPPPPPKPVVAEAKPEPPAPPPPPKYVTLNGVVRRSDGVTTVWLNDKPVSQQRTDEGLLVSTPNRPGAPSQVVVRVPQSGRSFDLKVGQQVEINSGQVQEVYERPSAAPAVSTQSVEPPPVPATSSSPRRSGRERELLRDLLREIQGQERAAQADTGKSPPSSPGTVR